MIVRTLAPDEWAIHRRVRLAALRTDPDAFGATLASSEALGEDDWRGRCDTRSWFAFLGDQPAGMARLWFDPASKPVPEIISVWVDPAHRGAGVGRRLVAAALAAAGKPGQAPAVDAGDVPLGSGEGDGEDASTAAQVGDVGGMVVVGQPAEEAMVGAIGVVEVVDDRETRVVVTHRVPCLQRCHTHWPVMTHAVESISGPPGIRRYRGTRKLDGWQKGVCPTVFPMEPPLLIVDELRLTAPTIEDAADWAAAQDDECAHWFDWPCRPSLERCRNHLVHVTTDEEPDSYTWAIRTPLGFGGGIDLKLDDGVWNVSYFVHPDHRGRHVARRALNAVTHWALVNRDIEAVVTRVHTENIAS